MSDLAATFPPILFGIAAMGMAFAAHNFIGAIIRLRRAAERWRDPAPMLFRLLLPLARLLAEPMARLPQHWQEPIQRILHRAGLGYAILPAEIIALRLITTCVGLALGIAVIAMLDLTGGNRTLTAAGTLALGFTYPLIWLKDHGRRRLQRIEREFPAMLELLALSVRAGLSFGAALEQCTRELKAGPLSDEFRRVAREVQTGASRAESLERMASRLDLPAVSAFVSAVIQADETGAAISQTLNDQAEQRRRARFAAAEKKANEAPVKMLLPLVGLLFPLTFLIIAFPIVLQFMDGGLL